MINCLFVGIGGFIGSVLRYLIGLLPVQQESGFPVKTFGINIVGAFVLGVLSAWVAKNPNVSPQVSLMLRVGVCGGFTTFSTFAMESSSLMGEGKTMVAVLYIVSSVVLGVLAAFLGQQLVR